MSDELRRVERKQADGTWQACRLADIRTGDVFRMWEPDGVPVVMEYSQSEKGYRVYEQATVFRATSDAYEGTWNGDTEGGLRTIVEADPVPQGSEAP
jgi:hypothetical protein